MYVMHKSFSEYLQIELWEYVKGNNISSTTDTFTNKRPNLYNVHKSMVKQCSL